MKETILFCLFLFLFASPALSAASFQIMDIQLSPEGRLVVRHESRANSYYILFRGESVADIRFAANLALGGEDTGSLTDPDPIASAITRFYRVLELPLEAPYDSDAHGIDDAYELQFPFLNPLAASSVIGPDQFFAEVGGERLAGRIETSSDRRKATLFYNQLLPEGAKVRVVFDAIDSTWENLVELSLRNMKRPFSRRALRNFKYVWLDLTDDFGSIVDADGDGMPGGEAVFEFETLSLTFFPGTSVCGRVFASELALSGDGERSVNVPLQGVTITVDGAEETMRAITDQNGDFRLEPAPAGRFFVHIDGRTASNFVPEGAYYPFVGKAWESVPGEESNIGEVYLPLVAEGTLQPISDTEPTVIGFPTSVLDQHPELAGVRIMVPPEQRLPFITACLIWCIFRQTSPRKPVVVSRS